MSLATLLDEIRADVRSTPEVARVYDEVPDSINEMPAIVALSLGARCWLASHGSEDGTTPLHCEHTIHVEVHLPRVDLAWAIEKMERIAPAVALRLYSGFVRDRYSGTMITLGDPRSTNAQGMLDYQLAPSKWDGTDTYMMSCDLRVTTEEEVLP